MMEYGDECRVGKTAGATKSRSAHRSEYPLAEPHDASLATTINDISISMLRENREVVLPPLRVLARSVGRARTFAREAPHKCVAPHEAWRLHVFAVSCPICFVD